MVGMICGTGGFKPGEKESFPALSPSYPTPRHFGTISSCDGQTGTTTAYAALV